MTGEGDGFLEGRSALVTGGSRGIGRAVAGALAERGVRLAVCSRGGASLFATARQLGALPVAADLERPEEVERLAGHVRERLGGAPDVLVNNAGVFRLAPAVKTDPAAFERHLSVNLAAAFRLTRAFLPSMLDRGSGAAVHIGSVAGRRPFPGNVAYAASKYGLRGMHDVLCLELEGTGVRSVLVEAGPVDTDAWDELEDRLGRDLPSREEMLSPRAVADGVVRILRDGDRTELTLEAGNGAGG